MFHVALALALAIAPGIAHAAVGSGEVDGRHAAFDAGQILAPAQLHDCDGVANILRRLSGCSALINSGDASGETLARAYRHRGTAFFSLGEKRRAIKDFDQAIRLDPDNAGLYYLRGTAWQHLGEHQTAIAEFDRAIALDPQGAAAYANRGVAWEKLGSQERALDDYDVALGLDPDNAVTLNNRGNVLARIGERQLAIRDYDRALRLDPTYARAYYNRAGELCIEGHVRPAVDDYLEAMRLGERELTAMQEFLSGKGYYAGQAETGLDAALETALRRWSEVACTGPGRPVAEPDATRPAHAEPAHPRPGRADARGADGRDAVRDPHDAI